MRSYTIITILDRDLIRTDTIRCVLVRVSRTDTICCDSLRLLAWFLAIVATIVSRWDRDWYIYFENKHIPHYVFNLWRRNNINGGAENDENATFALLMPYPSPYHHCLCCHFLASFRFRINTEKDHIDICFSVVDQRIKVILPDVFNVLIIRNRS